MRHRTALAVFLVAALVPTTAQAAHIGFGSSLKATPNRIESQPVDSAFWAQNLPGTRKFKVPGKGKVGTIKLKGNIVGNGNPNLIHFQILRPIGGGRVQVKLTSGNNTLPRGGDKNHITTYHPINLCAHKGDFVALSTVGGPKFQVFSSVMGATTNVFTGAGGDNNGDTFKGKKHEGEELLMRMVLWTGKGPGGAGICNSK
jgi:hypothetical protein